MAEIEIGILSRQCLARCGSGEQNVLAAEVAAWQKRRNAAQYGIERHERREWHQPWSATTDSVSDNRFCASSWLRLRWVPTEITGTFSRNG